MNIFNRDGGLQIDKFFFQVSFVFCFLDEELNPQASQFKN